MTGPLIDNSLTIDYLDGHPQAVSCLDGLRASSSTPLLTHPVVVAETLFGARNRREQAVIDLFFSDMFATIAIEPPDGDFSLELYRKLRLAHGVGWQDCLIAAAAIRLAIPIATKNEKHFNVIPNLRVIRPY